MRLLLALTALLLSAPLLLFSMARGPTLATERRDLPSPLLTGAVYEDGPPPAMTGGFGEATCEACHDGNPINEPGGSLLLDGIPSSYTPSSRYVITVKLARPALAKAGFEIASRFANGEAKGQQAGIWQPTDDRTQLASSPDGTVSYAEQTLKGAGVDPPGAAEWIINWTAPASAAAPIIFNVAANASDDNTSPIGDFIYVAEITSRPGGAQAAFRPVIQRPGSEPNGRRAALRRSSFLRASGKRMRSPEEL